MYVDVARRESSGAQAQRTSGAWWAGWSYNQGDRKRTVEWRNAPTGSLSGSTTVLWGQAGSYTGQAADADSNLNRIEYWVSPTSSNTGPKAAVLWVQFSP